MSESNKDGYVQHAFIGRQSVIDIDEANSNFEVADNKITGTVKGSITKEHTGNTDIFQLNLNNIPFIGGGGSGGSSNIEFVTITIEQDKETGKAAVTACDKTYEELLAAATAGKQIVGICRTATGYEGTYGESLFPFYSTVYQNQLMMMGSWVQVLPEGSGISVAGATFYWAPGASMPTVTEFKGKLSNS